MSDRISLNDLLPPNKSNINCKNSGIRTSQRAVQTSGGNGVLCCSAASYLKWSIIRCITGLPDTNLPPSSQGAILLASDMLLDAWVKKAQVHNNSKLLVRNGKAGCGWKSIWRLLYNPHYRYTIIPKSWLLILQHFNYVWLFLNVIWMPSSGYLSFLGSPAFPPFCFLPGLAC